MVTVLLQMYLAYEFSCDDRENMFHNFWQLSDVNKQRHFIQMYAVQRPKGKKLATLDNSRRNNSIYWYMPQYSDEVSKIRVCKTFFLGTLGISDKTVGTVHKKMNSLGICLDDKRGSHHNRPNKISEQTLEQGHTQNEGDAIHSSIENASRHVPVYTTSQWATLVRSARNKNPYIVTEMTLRDFYDFKGLADSRKVIWNSIKILQLNSAKQHQFQYQTDYEGDTFTVELFYRSRHSIPKPGNIPLQKLRSQSVPIPKLKYMDLVGLCQSNIIPRAHHAFYLILPHADK
ncbi:hypothetical protein MAR_004065 [Mya arenaria]|uniref:Uncharacterized protein n=1 Tax=Mya arenaria TaxID=6604 RepID=A0ABY7EXB3_MYAAR|nr:hypothetical protein MAR_004065 [Mya arenaria]